MAYVKVKLNTITNNKTGDFFVVPENGQPARCARHRNILTINYNTIDSQMQNEQIYNKVEDDFHCTNKTPEAGKPEKCSENTTSIQN